MTLTLARPAYEDASMHITFSDAPPAFDGSNLMLHFTAFVDGEAVACSISAEALEDHFGAAAPLEDDLLRAYRKGHARIRSVCAEALDQSGGAGVELHSGLFRVDGMEPDRGA